MTTTAATIRDSIESRIAALAPTAHAGDRFLAHRHELPLPQWANANTTGAFRRFSVRWDGGGTPPTVTDGVVAWEERDLLVIVAYPTSWRAGGKALVDLDNLAIVDAQQIDDAVGTKGYAATAAATSSGATVTSQGTDLIAGTPVTFATIRLRAHYYRTTS
jgi:hypothetical protein